MNEEIETKELNESAIITQCNEFTERSAQRYSRTIQRAINDMRMYSGDFWTDTLIKDNHRSKRSNLSLNNWNPMCNAISSPISASPWHIELCNRQGEADRIQQAIDGFEQDSDTKTARTDSFRKEVLTGYGFGVISTVLDEMTMQPKIVLESVRNLASIALDPSIETVDGSDAEEGAIVNFIPVKKARRLYGDAVVPMGYPDVECLVKLPITQWTKPKDTVPLVSYYVKNEQGFVDLYKICGSHVVEHIELPIKHIPIVRFAGNEIYENSEVNYNGIIQQTMSLELGANIAYSTLIERCGRSSKANYLVHVDAWDGLEEHNAKLNQDDTLAVLWKGEHQPVPLVETFQTGDLQNTISTCRTLMEDTLGVPLTGIVDNRERTATEILRQEASKESNTANYYDNAYKANRTIGRIIIELLNGGQDLPFSLENGPAVITRDMKVRQELAAMSSIMPDEMKPILAKYFADTLKNDVGEELSNNIVANMPNNLRLIANDEDPNAVHAMNQMQAVMEETNKELDAAHQEIEQLRQQLNQAQMSLLNQRESRVLDWEKFQVAEQDKMAIESAKLGVTVDKNMADAEIKNDANLIKATEVALKDSEKDIRAQQEVTDAYVKGASDMATLGGL
jgi:hypothetical protein